ncbi:MAG: HNH endonuclease [Nitrospirae bacterium RBG_13_43_8]|nr:MAG: HNH endonuclease [Nitrospirae bacterium RBG_13_43_8]
MKKLEKYIHQFAHLRRAPNPIFTEATKNRAPHKPLLLLAVLDLVARGVITSPFIDIHSNLVELNELFTGYWRRIMPHYQSSSIAFPFPRLHNEPFWKLVAMPGKRITPAVINSITTVSQLRTVALGARMDKDLFHFMQQPNSRNALRETLLRSCFSEKAQSALTEQSNINTEAFDYSTELIEKAHKPLISEVIETDRYKPEARDQGFRRAVMNAYDHRCALCGVRIITLEGHSVVDAAHIIPWIRSKNDDICNGMALCKLCHWAFDEGMLGVSANYNVITSRQIGADPNVPGFLLTLSGRSIIPPYDRDLWPDQEYLNWHRKEFCLSQC